MSGKSNLLWKERNKQNTSGHLRILEKCRKYNFLMSYHCVVHGLGNKLWSSCRRQSNQGMVWISTAFESETTRWIIDQFRYIKMQPNTIDVSTRLWGINPTELCSYSPDPRVEVYCVMLHFNISKLVYYSACGFTFKDWILISLIGLLHPHNWSLFP